MTHEKLPRYLLALPPLPTSRPELNQTDRSSDFDYENYNGGDVVTSAFPGIGQVPSAMKQRRDAEKETDSPCNLDDDNNYDDGGDMTSALSETEEGPSAVKQRRQKKELKDLKSTRRKGCGGRLSVVILYCLVVICFIMWSALLSVLLVKWNLTSVLEELTELQKGIGRIGKDVIHVQEKLYNLTDFFCLSCPPNWKHFERNCYFFSTSRGSWISAQQSCEAEGAHLVIINNGAEQIFLTQRMISDKALWVGLNDTVSEGKWVWVDGTPMTLSFWHTGEPNNMNGDEDCATLQFSGKWNDAPCSFDHSWICEKKC